MWRAVSDIHSWLQLGPMAEEPNLSEVRACSAAMAAIREGQCSLGIHSPLLLHPSPQCLLLVCCSQSFPDSVLMPAHPAAAHAGTRMLICRPTGFSVKVQMVPATSNTLALCFERTALMKLLSTNFPPWQGSSRWLNRTCLPRAWGVQVYLVPKTSQFCYDYLHIFTLQHNQNCLNSFSEL